jgi:hypothetical protein
MVLKDKQIFKRIGFTSYNANYNLYYYLVTGQAIVLLLYVNDLLIIRNHRKKINWIKEQLMQHFEMTNLRKMNYYLKIKFIYLEKGIFMSQEDYTTKTLELFGFTKCNSR